MRMRIIYSNINKISQCYILGRRFWGWTMLNECLVSFNLGWMTLACMLRIGIKAESSIWSFWQVLKEIVFVCLKVTELWECWQFWHFLLFSTVTNIRQRVREDMSVFLSWEFFFSLFFGLWFYLLSQFTLAPVCERSLANFIFFGTLRVLRKFVTIFWSFW